HLRRHSPAALPTYVGSVSGGLTAVDVQDLARHEGGSFEIQDPVDDVADLADPTDRLSHSFVGRRVVYWRLDDAGGDRVDADATASAMSPCSVRRSGSAAERMERDVATRPEELHHLLLALHWMNCCPPSMSYVAPVSAV